MIDASWSGTAHASTSSTTAARARLVAADTLSLGSGTIRVVFTPFVASTQFQSSIYFFSTGASEMRALWRESTGNLEVTDNANTLTAAMTWTAMETMTIHFVWDLDWLRMYKNGVLQDSDTYTPKAFGTHLYLLSTNAATEQLAGVCNGLTIFGFSMTAADVLADATEISAIGDNKRVDWLPTLWTEDGDDIVDNCTDSNQEGYAIAVDIPGDGDAGTIIDVTSSAYLT